MMSQSAPGLPWSAAMRYACGVASKSGARVRVYGVLTPRGWRYWLRWADR